MKFIIDGMLGKLARWLRMLGHNVIYSTKLDDFELIDIAKKEKCVILTRDLKLCKSALSNDLEAFYIEGCTEAEKLANLGERFNISLDINMENSRCPRCNAQIIMTPKEKIKDKIKKNTFSHYNEFWKCTYCGKVYWQGAHWKGILETLEEARTIRRNKTQLHSRSHFSGIS